MAPAEHEASDVDPARDLPVDPDSPSEGDEGAGRRELGIRSQLGTVAAISCGGLVGALCRYAVALGLPTRDGQFPWGTFWINLSGSAVLGLLLVVLAGRFSDRRLARPAFGTGMIGAYTTFSTFAVEAVQLVRDGHAPTAAVYVATSIVAGAVAVFAGMTAGRLALREMRLWHGVADGGRDAG